MDFMGRLFADDCLTYRKTGSPEDVRRIYLTGQAMAREIQLNIMLFLQYNNPKETF